MMTELNSLQTSTLKQQDFLRLMIAQIQQEHTLNPSEAESYGTYPSIGRTGTSLQSNQALQASALVGRTVFIKSNNLWLTQEEPINIYASVTFGLNDLHVFIYSSTGILVNKISLGTPDIGLHHILWDGTNQDGQRLAAGHYTVHIYGKCNGAEQRVPSLIWANVDSVSLDPQGFGVRLNLLGLGSVTLNQIEQILV